MVIDVIGLMYDLTDTENPVELGGYHVNSTEDVPEWAGYKVSPVTPACVFMGIDVVHCYKFANKQHFESLMEQG